MSNVQQGYFSWTPETVQHTLAVATPYFNQNGYAVLTSHATSDEIAALREAAASLIQTFYQSSKPTSVFTTIDQQRKMDDTYFLDSVNNISCFLEEEQEHTAQPAVNKIGHALHDLDPVFAAFSRSQKVRCIAEALGARNPLLIQSMYILKSPRVGGAVMPHRDAAFVRGETSVTGDCLGYWWALEDSTLDNGCLWVVPGSQNDGKHIRKLVLTDDGKKTVFVGENDLVEYKDDHYIPLPMKSGDLIIIHGGLVHKSLPNRSENSRHAYSIHTVAGSVQKDCWLQRRKDFPARPL